MISSTNGANGHGVDIGGMFADVVLATPDGRIESLNVLLTPDDYSRGILDGIAAVLERAGLVHATIVSTNAILEHEGARTGLVTNRGLRDVLEMRRLRMPVLYDLQYRKPKPPTPCTSTRMRSVRVTRAARPRSSATAGSDALPLRAPRSRAPRSGAVSRGEPCTASA